MTTPGGRLPFRLLAITDGLRPDLEVDVCAAVRAGGRDVAVLLRDPGADPAQIRRWAERLLPTCRAAGSLLLVHGSPEIARAVGADGVHLPERGPSPTAARAAVGPAALVGASRHDLAGLRSAPGADYATLSPIFGTPGKGAPLGLDFLAEVCRAVPIPMVALGGITPERAAECRAEGAAAVGAIRAVWEGQVPANVQRLLGRT